MELTTLAINAGSSTLKARLYRVGDGSSLGSPLQPIWHGSITWAPGADRVASAFALVARLWEGPEAPLESPHDLDAVGHRIVHGGTRYQAATLLTEEVKEGIEALAALAPLHNRSALSGIQAVERWARTDVPSIAVFDTAFHARLPAAAYAYAGPYEWLGADLRRFGFHGINHEYLAHRAARLLGRDLASLRLITCHLGAGASLAAVRGGRSVDTTMGFTPLEGLAMATRSGSIDPGLLLHLLIEEDVPAERLRALLNTESGLAGLSGTDGDMRQIEAAQRAGDHRARLAFAVYVHRLRRGIGAMLASLGGVDAIVFSGGVGENSEQVRREALAPFSFLGPIPELVIPAEEEWAIARSAATVVRAAGAGRSGSEVGAR
jgi:acetate kinase